MVSRNRNANVESKRELCVTTSSSAFQRQTHRANQTFTCYACGERAIETTPTPLYSRRCRTNRWTRAAGEGFFNKFGRRGLFVFSAPPPHQSYMVSKKKAALAKPGPPS